MSLNELIIEIHENAVAHGWWDEERTEAEIQCLIHSEWSEALEEFRAGRPMVWYGEDGKPEGIAVELIDGCIRIMDFLGKKGTLFRKEATSFNALGTLMATAVPDFSMHLCDLLQDLHTLTARKGNDEERLSACLFEVSAWLKCQGLDPEKILLEKHEYNKGRPYKHGGKKI